MPRLPLIAPLLLALAGPAAAAPVSPEQIDAAIRKATNHLKGRFKEPPGGGHDLSQAALAGLALLEADVPPTDPTVRVIAGAVREQALGSTRTYQLSLFLLFLDRLKDPADVPLIQTLAARLLVGQTAAGGWGYECIADVPDAVQKRLRVNLRAPLDPAAWPPGTLHPEVAAYARSLKPQGVGDDNSNTQFAVLAVWVARRHGVPADAALNRVEQRFRTTQNADGGWPYSGDGGAGSPSMTCAGLLGLATGVGRRTDRAVTAKAPAPKAPARARPRPDDPFFDPPPKAPKAPPPPPPPEARDVTIQRGLANVGAFLAGEVRASGGRGFTLREGGSHGYQDLYFLWSLERVGVVFGLEHIGGVDWYDAGVQAVVRTQRADGGWVAGGYEEDVNTALALLFLCKSNVVRDLSSSLQRKDPARAAPELGGDPGAADDGKAGPIAAELVDAPAARWPAALTGVRDAAGGEHTRALLLAIGRLDGDRRKQVREALAERLTRMTAGTLRAMLRADDPELRRAAALACAMKDDRGHVPDLIDRLTDDEEFVVRAARAGLRSLTGQDHGPENGAAPPQRKAAADRWRAATRGK